MLYIYVLKMYWKMCVDWDGIVSKCISAIWKAVQMVVLFDEDCFEDGIKPV